MALPAYKANINRDDAARSAYRRFRDVLGLPYFAPLSDAQRTAFDFVYLSAGHDFEKFLSLAASGLRMADCIFQSRKEEKHE